MVADFDDQGGVIGLGIEQASTGADVARLGTSGLPIAQLRAA